MIEVSVVVPTHNRSGLLPGLFASLASQTFPPHLWELVVVNDGSKDDTSDVLRRLANMLPVKVTIVDQQQRGSAVARNAGAQLATGRVLLFLDDDMIATQTLISAHAQAHSGHSTAAIGRISAPQTRREPWTTWEDVQLAEHSGLMARPDHVLEPRDFYSGNCSISAALFRSVGGFNTTLERTYDLELGYRLKAANASIVFCSGAESTHIGRHTFREWLENARRLGDSELVMGWQLGHVELQSKIFEWYLARHVMIRALVRLCARHPNLEAPLIACMHGVGQFSHAMHARFASNAAYSAIFNLAYWMKIVRAFGPDEFLNRAERARSLRLSRSNH